MAQGSDFTPIDRVVAIATSTMKDVSPADRAFFREWIALGLGEIGPSSAWIGEPVTIYPTELTLRKPSDMWEPIDIALYDASDNEIKYTFRGKSKRIHTSRNNCAEAPVDLSEDAYYFHLGSNGSGISYARVTYFKFPVDENGDILIAEKDIFALTCFVDYMMAKRNGEKQYLGMYYNMWKQAKKEATAAHKLPSKMEMDQIAKGWNSMIKRIRFRDF